MSPFFIFKNMKYISASLLVILFSCSTKQNEEKNSSTSTSKRVGVEEFKKIIADTQVQLVDVRTAKEYDAGFINNAINIDFLSDDFISSCNKLDKTKPIAIYCAAGGRSAKAMKKLKEAGFTEVYELGVGYKGYY